MTMGMTKFKAGDGALVVFPPKPVRGRIDRWRRIYDPYHKIIPPHVTMVFPFMREKTWNKNRAKIASNIKTFAPFTITLREIHFFKGEPRVLWLKPSDKGELSSIHESLRRQFPKYVSSSGFDFVPHLSIGFLDTDQALRDAWKIVSDAWRPVTFKVDRIYYVVHNQRGRWRIKSTLPLGRD
jgi:2'-5' RNA ligase